MYIDQEFIAGFISKYLYGSDYQLVKSLIEVFFLFSIYVLNEGVRQLEENDDTWKPFIIKNETTDDKEFLTIYTPAYETDVTVKEVYDTILAKTKNIYEEIVEDFRKSAIKKMQSEIQ
ncbi:hypothetical protein [Globicatella sanguinis]|uniref:hypothetical protein n=1 Tax=Globicatella sanguinis TaxID=13076 RepID=UPI000824705A|nr:hypothetical protein [Globicatella sanguinis]